MICKNCGTEIDDQAEVCYTCGHPVKAEPNPAAAPIDAFELTDPSGSSTADDAVYPAAPVEYVPPKASGFVRVISFLFALIGFIIYLVKKRNGQDAQAISVADSIMAGLCAKMVIGIGCLIYVFMLRPLF